VRHAGGFDAAAVSVQTGIPSVAVGLQDAAEVVQVGPRVLTLSVPRVASRLERQYRPLKQYMMRNFLSVALARPTGSMPHWIGDPTAVSVFATAPNTCFSRVVVSALPILTSKCARRPHACG
jgi:hypothetical protein